MCVSVCRAKARAFSNLHACAVSQTQQPRSLASHAWTRFGRLRHYRPITAAVMCFVLCRSTRIDEGSDEEARDDRGNETSPL